MTNTEIGNDSASADELMASGSLSEKLLFYPEGGKYPFDSTCREIIHQLQRLEWQVPGIKVNFRISKFMKPRPIAIQDIEGDNFRLIFASGFNGYGIDTIDIPQRHLEVFSDFSGPIYNTYRGFDWKRDMKAFREQTKHCFVYTGSDHKDHLEYVKGKLTEYLIPDRYANDRKLRFPWEPAVLDTKGVMNEFNIWLSRNVLEPLKKIEPKSIQFDAKYYQQHVWKLFPDAPDANNGQLREQREQLLAIQPDTAIPSLGTVIDSLFFQLEGSPRPLNYHDAVTLLRAYRNDWYKRIVLIAFTDRLPSAKAQSIMLESLSVIKTNKINEIIKSLELYGKPEWGHNKHLEHLFDLIADNEKQDDNPDRKLFSKLFGDTRLVTTQERRALHPLQHPRPGRFRRWNPTRQACRPARNPLLEPNSCGQLESPVSYWS